MTDYALKYASARDRVLAVLLDLEWHEYADLERVGGNRYCARLLELRRLGYQIETRVRDDHGKSYRLLSAKRGEPQGKQVKVYLDEMDAALAADGVVTSAAADAVKAALESFESNRGKL